MSLVVGVDFGTLSVRVSILDSEGGALGSATAGYPVHRKPDDPEYATQSHVDQMMALQTAMSAALKHAKISGGQVEAMALGTTGSTVAIVGKNLEPIDEYYLWCDHRSKQEALAITEVAHREGLPAIQWCGGTYSPEWGFSKLLHWLRQNPARRSSMLSAFEHCDLVAATLCGISDPKKVRRSVCAMGHKWMWNRSLGGYPSQEFFSKVDPLFDGVVDKLQGEVVTSDQIAGYLSAEWAKKLGLRPGIPIPVGALDAHWDAIGAGCRIDDIANVIGTSTCIIGITSSSSVVPGVCGVVEGSVHPRWTGIEAGLSASGDVFEAIARRAGTDIASLNAALVGYRAGQTGLLRISWDNGDRTVLANPNVRGVVLGWNLQGSAQDELFAAIEGTALQTRVILDRMEAYGVPMRRVINGGGVPAKSDLLNQIYANGLDRPVLVARNNVASLGAAMFAFLAAGSFKTIEEAQEKLGPTHDTYLPNPVERQRYDELYKIFKTVYFTLGNPNSGEIGKVLPALIGLSEIARKPGATKE